MMRRQNSKKNGIWLVPVLVGLALIQCNTISAWLPPTPTKMVTNTEVSDLYASHSELLVGETAEVGVGVVKLLGADLPLEYQWSTTGGLIIQGQGTCCISYQAPNTPGTYDVQLIVKHGEQIFQRSIAVRVIAPTAVPEPTATATLTVPTETAVSTAEAPLTDAGAYFERAQASFGKRDYEQTIADYTTAIELNYEPLSEVYYNRGYVYYTQREYAEAIGDFDKALELNYEPRSLVFYNRGNAYFYSGDNERAIADYSEAIQLNHEPLSWLYNSRGLAHRRNGEYERAIADYTQAIALRHEPLSWPYYNRGNAFADLQAYEQAIADFNEAIRIDASDAGAYYARGLVYRKTGDSNRAIADFSKVVEIDNNFWRTEAEAQLQELGAE